MNDISGWHERTRTAEMTRNRARPSLKLSHTHSEPPIAQAVRTRDTHRHVAVPSPGSKNAGRGFVNGRGGFESANDGAFDASRRLPSELWPSRDRRAELHCTVKLPLTRLANGEGRLWRTACATLARWNHRSLRSSTQRSFAAARLCCFRSESESLVT